MRATLSRKFRNLAGVSAVALIALAAPAGATVITSAVNNPLNFSWSYNTGTSILDGTGLMTVSGFNTGSLTLVISLTNDAALSSERLTAFGIGITPNATGVSFSDASDGGMEDAALGANFPAIQSIEICAFGGPTCAGGGPGGILGGGSDTFSLILAGSWGSSVDVDPIGFKYQTGYGSFEFTGTPGPGPGPIPEPATLALFGLGVAGLGLVSRRRRRQA